MGLRKSEREGKTWVTKEGDLMAGRGRDLTSTELSVIDWSTIESIGVKL